MKSLTAQLDLSILKRAFIMSLVYFIAFDSAILLYKYDHYKAGKSLAYIELFKESCYVFVMIFAGFVGFSVNNLLFKIYSFFLYITGGFVSYYVYSLKVLPSKQIVKAFFDVESVEAYELVSLHMVGWVVVSCLLCIYLLQKYETKNTPTQTFAGLCFILLFASIANIATPFYRVFNSYLPTNYLHNTYDYFLHRFSKNAKKDIVSMYKFQEHADKNLIAVLVIGESARYDHFNKNYSRDTVPRLRSIPNLSLNECTASSNATYISVSSMLSNLPISQAAESLSQSSLLSVFRSLDFNTVWIATQSLTKYFRDYDFNLYDEVNSSLIPGGSVLYALSSHDEVMLPYFESEIAKNQKAMIVLHMSGSHWKYDARYPENFKKFLPICADIRGKMDHSSCPISNLTNSYDNSLLYTDFFLSEVISKLKDKNAFMIYVSDHGESLGDNGFYGHGGEQRPEQMQVPLVIWFSDKFLASHSPIGEISANAKFSHDNIFHSMLDCASIESPLVNKSLSLCNDSKK